MITAQVVKEVSSGGIAEQGNFSIRGTAKAFRILSDGLYSDKPLAVVRELSCNAYDSHVAAGHPERAFEVHLPNGMEPFFSVKDYGVGLSHEQVMKLYTTYFESTKSESNDFIGALGLGSKSPFSYVDQFTVVSRFNGTARSYTAFIAENGVPSIALMNETTTEEPNGLEVSMPVKASDFNTFLNRAQQLYRRFDPMPVIKGAPVAINPVKVKLQGTGWFLRESGQDSGAYAVMGNVGYKLDASALGNASDFHRTIIGMDIEIQFPIGALEVQASREGLSYDPRTSAEIKKMLDVVYAEIPRESQAVLDKCKTLWEAKRAFKAILDGHGWDYRNMLAKQLKWHGLEVKDQYINFDLTGTPGVWVGVLNRHEIKRKKIYFDHDIKGSVTPSNAPGHRVFWHDGTQKHLNIALRQELSIDNGDDQAIVFFAPPALYSRVLKALGNPPKVEKVSDIALPPRQKAVRSGVAITQPNFRLIQKLESSREQYWQDEKVNLADGGIYVTLAGGQPTHNGQSISGIGGILSMARRLGIDVPVLYGFSVTYKSLPSRLPNWHNIFDLIFAKLAEAQADAAVADRVAALTALDGLRSTSTWGLLAGVIDDPKLLQDHSKPFGLQAAEAQRLIAAAGSEQDYAVFRALRQLSATESTYWDCFRTEPIKAFPECPTTLADLNKVYPLFELRGGYNRGEVNDDNWFEYINLIDKR